MFAQKSGSPLFSPLVFLQLDKHVPSTSKSNADILDDDDDNNVIDDDDNGDDDDNDNNDNNDGIEAIVGFPSF